MSTSTSLTTNLITFEICLINTPAHSDSSGSNHLSKFTVLVIVALTKREDRKKQRQQAKRTHSLLLSIVMFCMRIIPIL